MTADFDGRRLALSTRSFGKCRCRVKERAIGRRHYCDRSLKILVEGIMAAGCIKSMHQTLKRGGGHGDAPK